MTFRVLKSRFWAFSLGPGGFGELREAGRNHFHPSWYLSVSVVTSYHKKPYRKYYVRSLDPGFLLFFKLILIFLWGSLVDLRHFQTLGET